MVKREKQKATVLRSLATTLPVPLTQIIGIAVYWFFTQRTLGELILIFAIINLPLYIILTILQHLHFRRVTTFLNLLAENSDVVRRIIKIFIEITKSFLDVRIGFLPLVEDKSTLAKKAKESLDHLDEITGLLDNIKTERIPDQTMRITTSFLQTSISSSKKWHLVAYKALEATIHEKSHCDELKSLIEKMSEDVYDKSVRSVHILLNLKHSIELISRLSKESNDYQYNILNGVFKQFSNIWESSEQIINEAKLTALELVNENKSDSLGFIKRQSSDVFDKFSSIRSTVAKLVEVSQEFTSATSKNLKSIQETSRQIAELSEKVKLITVNIRIEAARLVGQKHGFKVLGTEISEFADSTSAFANDSHDKVVSSIVETDKITDEFEVNLTQMEHEFSELERILFPFNSILQNTMHRFESIISDLQSLSEQIHDKVKSSIGSLQIHDIRNQESEHLVGYMKELFETISNETKEADMALFFSPIDETEITNNIVKNYRKFATTENERKVIESFTHDYRIEDTSGADQEDFNLDDGTILF